MVEFEEPDFNAFWPFTYDMYFSYYNNDTDEYDFFPLIDCEQEFLPLEIIDEFDDISFEIYQCLP